MKCPKCNYTSFDYLDSCRKCSADLREPRVLLQIIAVAPDQRVSLAAAASPVSRSDEPSPADAFAATGSDFLRGDEAPAESFGHSAEPEDIGVSSINFDESFESIVEPTSYREEKAAPEPEPAASDDDELLDLDFADVFGDKGEESGEPKHGPGYPSRLRRSGPLRPSLRLRSSHVRKS